MKGRTRDILIHIICCIAFLAVPLYFEPGPDGKTGLIPNSGALRDFMGTVITLGYFYLNYYLIIPRYFTQKKYLAFSILSLLCFMLVTAIPALLVHVAPMHHGGPFPGAGMGGPPPGSDMKHMDGPPPGGPMHGMPFIGDISHNVWRFLVVFTVSLLLKINARLKEIQQEKLNAELSYLKAQINPHFLFNTLNTVYALAIEQSKNTADAVLQLSGMMRYVISEANHDFVPLDRELGYIQNYISLQRLRLGDTIQLSYETTGSPTGRKISPLTLIPFIENAFKHGVNPEENSDIRIRIVIDEHKLQLDVTNNKVHVLQAEEDKSGLGIENTRGRLQALYPGTHKLTINDNTQEYSVSLILEF